MWTHSSLNLNKFDLSKNKIFQLERKFYYFVCFQSTEGDWLSETIENDDEQSDANDSDYASSDGENLEPVFGESESGEEENDADDDDDGDNDDEYDDEDEDNSEQEVEDSDDNLRNEDAEISQIQTSISSNVKVSDNNKNAPNKKLTEKNRKTNQTKSGNSKSNKQFGAKCTKNDISSNTVDSDTTKTKVMKTQIADLSQDKNDEYVNDSSDEEVGKKYIRYLPLSKKKLQYTHFLIFRISEIQ